MNRFKIITLVLAFAVFVPCLVFALPGAHDPKSTPGYTCGSCHNSGSTYGNSDVTYSSNVCLRCHASTGALTPKSNFSFETEDYANPFNTTANIRPTAYQTSHKWFGSVTSANAKGAGVVAPIDGTANGLNKSNFPKGFLFCNRCHNVHGNTGSQSTMPPYLRTLNNADQMCLNCHRKRDTKDHRVGTHPVNVSYTSASVKAKKLVGLFLENPVTNASNPTGQVKLVNGKVVCSTCHGVHNADSRSSTFDPFSSNHQFGRLSSSKGYLLRVDARGKSANATNICTNCHANKTAHNKVSQNVQCNDCHSGHVEYDAAAVGNETTPNIFLVRRYLQYSTVGRVSKRIFYRYTGSSTKEFYNAAGKGVCQSCHYPPDNHYVGSNKSGGFNGTHTICSGCHKHSETAGSFSYGTGSCATNTCHGLPPVSNVVGAGGKANGYNTFDEGTTPHKSHAAGGGPNVNDFDCNECHKGAGSVMPLTNGDFVEVFKNHTGILAGAAATYTGSNCNNVYCHSNGRGIWKAAMNPIAWGNDKQGTIVGQTTPLHECNFCHDDPNSSASHTRHVATQPTGMGFGCVACHAATVSNNTTLLSAAKTIGGTHTNAVKDVQYSGTGAATGSSCATVACHSNGNGAAPVTLPVWGTASTGACGACHLTGKTSPVLQTGSHLKHFGIISSATGTANPLTVCARCHLYAAETAATHANGTVNVTTGCSTCHADPYSAAVATPTWGTSSPGCGACHNGVGAFTGTGTAPATGSHNKHMALPAALCNQCHTGAVAGSAGGTAHTDGDVDVTGGYPANVTKHAPGTYAGGICSNASCHDNGKGTPAPSPTWGVAAAACAACHGAVPATDSHPKHLSTTLYKTSACADCHNGTVQSVSAHATDHLDTNIDVYKTAAGDLGYTPNKVKGSAFGTCATAYCHSSGQSANGSSATPVYGTVPTWGGAAACGSCHATSTFTTGSHTLHLASDTNCGSCHTGATLAAYNNVTHVDGQINVAAGLTYANQGTPGNGYSSCSATTCHGTGATPAWGANTANDKCTKCHGTLTTTAALATARYNMAPKDDAAPDTGKVSTNTKIGAHQTHLQFFNGFSNYSTVDYRCQACHGTLPTLGNHANGASTPAFPTQNLATNHGTMSPTWTAGTFTCTNTYCHNPAGTGGTLDPANDGTGVAPVWTNSAYLGNTAKTQANCGMCHKSPGDVGFTSPQSHTANITQDCSGCHGHNGDAAGSAGQRHMDGIKYGDGACNTCHGYPPMTAAQLAARGGGEFVNAALEFQGGGGYHSAHLLTTLVSTEGFTPCLPCHPSGATHNQGGGTVVRANVNVNDAADAGYRFDSSRSKRYNMTSRTCSNVSCHFKPTTPAW